MTGRRRSELTDSFRLFATDEQWLLRDLLVGALALVVWVAGTGALATQVARAIDFPLGLASGETPSTVAIVVFGVLWLVVPAVAAVVRLHQRTLNLRGNVEQYYRLDHPAALLVPPALLVSLVVAIAVGLGAFPWYFTLVMIPVSLVVLVRTLAFSYRVYSFSHPLLVQVLVALSTVVLLASAFAAIGTAMGRPSLVDQVLRAVGLPAWITGTVSLEGVTISGLAAVTLLPVVLATAYVLVQTGVALGVRLVKPDVDRAKMRTGQRYPPFLPTATPVQTPGQPTGPEDASDVDDAPAEAADAATAGSADAAEAADAEESDEPAGGADDDLDDVSNTRVFTPPADDGDTAFETGSGTDSRSSPDAGQATSSGSASTAPDETRAVPASDDGASTPDRREHCDACGESFTVDTAVRFCPNCGGALGDE